MKASKVILLLVFVFCVAIQCIAQKKKVALVTFYIDKQINTSQVKGMTGLIWDIKQLAQNPDFDLQPIVNEFYNTFYTEYQPLLPFELIPEEIVIENPDYKVYESKQFETLDSKNPKFWRRYSTPRDYKIIYSSHTSSAEDLQDDVTAMNPGGGITIGKKENRNEVRLLKMFDEEAAGVLFVKMAYAFKEKRVVNGVGLWGIRAYIEMILYNKEGKVVFFIDEYAMSRHTVPMVFGMPSFSPTQLLPLCRNASEKLMADLEKKLPKKLTKKVAKKL